MTTARLTHTALVPSVLHRGPLETRMMSVGALEIVLTQLATTIDDGVEGDVVEMGCWQGTTSVLLRSFLDAAGSKKVFHVYDSFEGLPPAGPQDRGEGTLERPFFETSVDTLVQRFRGAGLRPPVIHVGWFAEIPEAEMPQQVAFAFLDGDLYESIRDSLHRVLPVLAPGGRIVVDDCGWSVTPGVEQACREVLAETPGFELSMLDGYKADVVAAEDSVNGSCGALIRRES